MSLGKTNTRMLTGAEFDRWENTYTTVQSSSASWAGGGGGTGWTLIDEGAVTSVNSVIQDNIFTDDYKEYQLCIWNIRTSSNSVMWCLRLRSGGSDITSNNYLAAWHGRNVAGNDLSSQGPNTDAGWYIRASDGVGTNQFSMSTFTLFPRLSIEQMMRFDTVGRNYQGNLETYRGGGALVGYTSNVDGFKIRPFFGEGTYTVSLTWKLYGR